jgi:hypothetical protein
MNRGSMSAGAGRRLRVAWAAATLLVLTALLAAAWVPPTASSREELFEIPPGTYARRMAGQNVAILPDTIHLTQGRQDVLLLRNHDEVPQTFGPVLIMPGQSFRLPFEKAATYHFACTAHAAGQMTIVVHPPLSPGWPTLQWRWRRLQRLLS